MSVFYLPKIFFAKGLGLFFCKFVVGVFHYVLLCIYKPNGVIACGQMCYIYPKLAFVLCYGLFVNHSSLHIGNV